MWIRTNLGSYGEKKPEQIEPKFCFVVDVRDIITWFELGGDRLKVLGSAEGQILPFPVDFDKAMKVDTK